MKKTIKRLMRSLAAMLLISAIMVQAYAQTVCSCDGCFSCECHSGEHCHCENCGSELTVKSVVGSAPKLTTLSSTCGIDGCNCARCSSTTEYVSTGDTYHEMRAVCTQCNAYTMVSRSPHTMSNGVCTRCGYTETCKHNSTTTEYTQYSSTQHHYETICDSCNETVYCGYSSHSYYYGSWSKTSTQHSRKQTCSYCGYSTTQTGSHSYTYGSWSSYSGSQHCRTATCSVCGYSTYEYASHSFSYGAWTPTADGTQHSRTAACSDCGYSTTEYADHADDDGDGFCDSCGYEMSRFSVTVPTSLDLVMAEDGTVYTPTTAAIQNDSTAAVEVASVTVGTVNGWTLVPALYNMASAHVDSKLISFCVNDCWANGTGSSEELDRSGDWTIGKGESLSLDYDARISATSVPLNEQVLMLTFVVRWDE